MLNDRVVMKIKYLKNIITIFLLLIVVGCEKNDKSEEKLDFALTSFKHTDCKEDQRKVEVKEYVEYKTVNKNFLQVNHINTEFNCCPGKLSTRATIVKDTIKIVEKEEKQDCKCVCKYDFSFQLGSLKYGKYHIVIVKKEKEHATFDVDFNATTNGLFLIKK